MPSAATIRTWLSYEESDLTFICSGMMIFSMISSELSSSVSFPISLRLPNSKIEVPPTVAQMVDYYVRCNVWIGCYFLIYCMTMLSSVLEYEYF